MADMGKHNGGGPAGKAFHAVMLRHPEAPVSCCLCDLCQRRRFSERLANAAAFADGNEVEDGKRDHFDLLAASPSCAR